MMPEVSIYYLMAIFRVFLLIIGQKQNFSVIASTKNGIDMKCHDSLKPLCGTETRTGTTKDRETDRFFLGNIVVDG